MTTDSVPAGDDPRRLLSDVRALAHRVRLDQRVTWVALLVLAVVTFAAIPIAWYSVHADCGSSLDLAHRQRNRSFGPQRCFSDRATRAVSDVPY